jgi:hypothetical protein
MHLTDLAPHDIQWRKASRSANDGACVEVALVNDQIAVRDSRNPGGGLLQYSAPSWHDFISVIKSESSNSIITK